MQYSLQPRLHLELGLIKLVQAGRLKSIEQALADLGNRGKTCGSRFRSVAHGHARAPALCGRYRFKRRPLTSRKLPGRLRLPKACREPPQNCRSLEKLLLRSPPVTSRQILHNALRTAGLAFSADAVANAEVQLKGGELMVRAPKAMTVRAARSRRAASGQRR